MFVLGTWESRRREGAVFQPAQGCRQNVHNPGTHRAALLAPRPGRDSVSAAVEHPFSYCFPWIGFPAPPEGAKTSNFQVSWHKKRSSGALPQTLFLDVALGSSCPQRPQGRWVHVQMLGLSGTPPQPCETQEFCENALVLNLKELFASQQSWGTLCSLS